MNGRLELWGGVECSTTRVGDAWRDQVAETGHRDRSDDMDLIADLGITALRYPILWESISPDDPSKLDFAWTDERLARLRDRGVRVIGGLCHHGSGPRYTDLLDPAFPDKLADFAARAAERYPWIEDWTPVNEPLTTARFSALYGHWYPHKRDFGAFLRALAHECSGTLRAMRAIRAVVPSARLIQTEDLGKIFSTAPLRYQAAHENERRWLSLDLLCGRVRKGHAFYDAMRESGVSKPLLDELASGEATPDLIGINHYVTSERFLDHRLHLYPDIAPGGNGRHAYVDAEAVRVAALSGKTGPGPRLREAWRRYHIPMAITEVHHGCTRDEQLRWFAEVWRAALDVREEGVDLRAVTLWSLFGNVDWRSLLTRQDGVYDVGAFDARSQKPRATVLAAAARAFAHGQDFDHPVLDTPGWWRRGERLYPWNKRSRSSTLQGRTLLITGATGTLGRAFSRISDHRGLPHLLTSRNELDLCSADSIRSALDRHRPWAVVNAAGFVRVQDAERERDACFAANSHGPETLAQICAEAGVPLVTFSSDLVFNGRQGPYREEDPVNPVGAYGLSKAEAESRVLRLAEQALVIRTAAFFGPWDKYNFAWHILNGLARGEPVSACPKTIVSPTYVPDLCHAALDLLIDGEQGVWHLTNQGNLSWHEFARRLAERAGYDGALVQSVASGDGANTALASGRGALLRPVDHAIDAFVAEVKPMIAA
ncbi:sugar nucleotide-binding protein [Allosphingosinicella flava]|uniref:dTDP-4-dehydrorhamnose reductase n=1 Tax=Allosphingosinicella flava TaxID=2771430 RepID=A0A7T2GM31_9SPHN|nr:sugar nucleotide-binding protein [Sphingosinicella flava]